MNTLAKTGSFNASDFCLQERKSEFTGDTEYSVDGEYWDATEEEALANYKEREDPLNHNMIY